ncbi:hypothetical protein B296_00017884 [Ensete ventricosum]|uniref:Uncharacterized protein n=1 Tax=Ensete ventricosum TaxID=4639 RepID=A0A426ZRJ9_ENSVE|nr:hypothetical protein B296_00017884 [Ensete ventricosum]
MISAETASRPPPCALFKTWGSQRLVPFVNASGKGKTAVAAAEGASTRNPACGDDSGLDQVREKLLVHLREAADRMNLVVPSSPPPPQQPKDGRPWNLRARRGRPRVPTEIEHHLGGVTIARGREEGGTGEAGGVGPAEVLDLSFEGGDRGGHLRSDRMPGSPPATKAAPSHPKAARLSVSRRMAVGGLPPTRIGFRSSLSGEVSTPAVT